MILGISKCITRINNLIHGIVVQKLVKQGHLGACIILYGRKFARDSIFTDKQTSTRCQNHFESGKAKGVTLREDDI